MELSAATKKCLVAPESVLKILNSDKNQDLKISAQEIKTAKKVCALEDEKLFSGYQTLTGENPQTKNPSLDYYKVQNLPQRFPVGYNQHLVVTDGKNYPALLVGKIIKNDNSGVIIKLSNGKEISIESSAVYKVIDSLPGTASDLTAEQIRTIQANLINPQPKEVPPAKTETPLTPETTRAEETPAEKPTPKATVQKEPAVAPERKFKNWWEWKFLLPGYSAHMNDPTATVDKYVFGISQGLLAAKFLDVATAKLETTTKTQFDYYIWATDSSSGDLKQISPLYFSPTTTYEFHSRLTGATLFDDHSDFINTESRRQRAANVYHQRNSSLITIGAFFVFLKGYDIVTAWEAHDREGKKYTVPVTITPNFKFDPQRKEVVVGFDFHF
jgi:hypothetical protein